MSPPNTAPVIDSEPQRGPFRLTIALLVVATLTILKGAMTTSTGSGLAYDDYVVLPLSDGQLLPESSYTTVPGFLEHFHRLTASAAGLMALALAIWLQLRPGVASRARRTAWGGGFLLLAQALFGGIGVLLKLPPITSVVHGTLAQLTFATFAWLAYQLSERHARTAPLTTVPAGSGRRLAVVALAVMIVQTVLGAIARHANSPHALWTHAGNALVVFVVVTIATAFAIGRLGETPGIKGIARAIVALLLTQIALGFVALAIRNPEGKTEANVERLWPAFVISVHVLIGALLTMLVATLAAHVFRATRRPATGDARVLA
jgi:heme A synthase